MKQSTMKKLLCVVVLVMASLSAGAQVKAFEKYAEMKDVSYIYISKHMLALAGKNAAPSIPKMDMQGLKNKLTAIQIVHAERNAMCTKLKEDVAKIVARDKYEVQMQVREDGQKADIYFGSDKEQSVVVMLVDEDGEVTVVVFSGKFSIDDVAKMTE